MRRSNRPAVAVFARVPIAGRAKTRLIPALGPQGAANFQAALISDSLRKISRLSRLVQPYLFVSGRFLAHSTNCGGRSHVRTGGREFEVVRQQGRSLGKRLENGFRKLLRSHAYVVVIGTDSPLLPSLVLGQAVRELKVCDAVLGPCLDGGFYLVGLRQPIHQAKLPAIFQRVRWSSIHAFSDTLRNVLRLGLSCSVLESCADTDRPADLRRLKANLKNDRRARRLAPATWNFLSKSSFR